MKINFKSEDLKLIFSRNFNIVTIINFLIMLAYYQIFVTTTSFTEQTFNVSLSAAGASLGFMVIGCLLGRFISGNLIQIISPKILLSLTLFLYALLVLPNFTIDNLYVLYLIRFLSGLILGSTATVTGTVMAYCVPPIMMGLGVSIFSLSTALALALGPFLGMFLMHETGFNVLYSIVLTLSVISFVIRLFLNIPQIKSHGHAWFKLSNYIDAKVMSISAVALFMELGYGSLASYLATFAAQRDIQEAAAFFFLISAITTILSRPISERLFDLYGENLVLYPSILLTAVALLLVSIANSAPLILLAGFFQGLGFGNFQSAGQALALRLVSKERYAQATSTFFIFFDLSVGISPALGGIIATNFNFTFMFVILSVLTFLAAVLYYFVHGKDHPLKKQLLKPKASPIK